MQKPARHSRAGLLLTYSVRLSAREHAELDDRQHALNAGTTPLRARETETGIYVSVVFCHSGTLRHSQ